MKKMNKLVVIGLLAASTPVVGVALPNTKTIVSAQSQTQVTLKKWGATKLYTTPKAARGTWYYRDDQDKLQKLKITTHTINGIKIYRDLSDKQFVKYSKKMQKMSTKKSDKLYNWFSKHLKAGSNIKRKGIKGMNINEWLAEGGSGAEFLPTTRTKNGQKVKALKMYTGAFIAAGYAYQDAQYAKKSEL